ncbi:MAG: hypothetical protein U5K72_05295 [Balneolaceae bacterium]|nr:hypothetical protein [Balneolaceae bacterium]
MKKTILSVLFATMFISTIHAQEMQECFPEDLLPDHITQLTDFGQRSEWSHDGERVFFVDKAGGEVFMVNVNTKETTQITDENSRPEGHGYYRVFELWNGDLLLGHGPERHVLYFQILDESLEFPAQTIEGENFDEGPAVSRTTNKIAWTLPEQEEIYFGEIVYDENGQPDIANKQLLVDNSKVVDTDGNRYEEILESQDWAPGEENVLVWNQYHRNEHGFRADIMSIDLETRTIVNHTKTDHLYHEAEGIFPDTETTYTLVESDQHNPTSGTGTIDLYKLEIDRDAAINTDSYDLDDYMERLTFFSDTEGFRSSNGVISDNGNWMVFQGSISGSDAGVGCGLYLYDLRHE